MGNVRFDLDAQSAKAVRGFLKIVDVQKKVAGGTRKATRATKDQDNAMARAGKQAAKDAKSMVTGWLKVGAAVAGVTKGITAQIEEAKRLAAQQGATTKSLIEAIAGAGDLPFASVIQRRILHRTGGMALRPKEEGIPLYDALRGAAPTMEIGRFEKIYSWMAEGKKAGNFLGAGPTDFGTIGGTIGKLFPNMAADDVADVTAFLSQARGRHGKKFTRGGLKAVSQWNTLTRGKHGMTGLGLALAGLESEQGAEPLQAIVQKLGEKREFAPQTFGKKLSDKEAAQRRFYGLTGIQRYEALKKDPSLVDNIFEGSQVGGVKAMLARDPTQYTRDIHLAMKRDEILQAQDRAMARPNWANLMAKHEAEAEAQKLEYYKRSGLMGQSLEIRAARRRQNDMVPLLRWIEGVRDQWQVGLGVGRVDPHVQGESRAQVEREAARELREAARNLRQATEKLPAHNAHGER